MYSADMYIGRGCGECITFREEPETTHLFELPLDQLPLLATGSLGLRMFVEAIGEISEWGKLLWFSELQPAIAQMSRDIADLVDKGVVAFDPLSTNQERVSPLYRKNPALRREFLQKGVRDPHSSNGTLLSDAEVLLALQVMSEGFTWGKAKHGERAMLSVHNTTPGL